MSHQGRYELRVLFWRCAFPTSSQLSLASWYLDKAPSLSRNAEFGALKALSVADNGGSLYCRRAGRRNFYRHAFGRLHRRFKVFDNRRRDAKMFPTPSTRAPSVFSPPPSSPPRQRSTEVPTDAPRLRQFWVHLRITSLPTRHLRAEGVIITILIIILGNHSIITPSV